MISDELRDSYLLAADACRYAAEQGWRPADGLLVYNHDRPTEWSCCALGAVALKREVSAYDLPLDPASFAETLEFVADMPMGMALGDAGGPWAAQGVAYIFDSIVHVWDMCVQDLYVPYITSSRRYGYVLRELNHTHESMAKLTPTEVWLLAAKRFEQLAN